ncbi:MULTISPECIES: hypothetical protein [Acinetobacter]|uniref:hypothetical protein n=1 Tax=Acinetobacter TaxID=469 RepID=UPI0002CF00B9|nr:MULTISPECIES: hypothetical protein [Acinetobacter]MCJ0829800.1 hypothetical protein [Acinetobacter sp. NIPH1876]ENX63898.1 hypothetical protein F885_00642 [Acinetobacter higginsii]MCH7317423.1 hypothetical protein [Acinetobacter higginsii]MCH7380304.1 hypothetical protein [Acinetobacter higginsii]MDO3665197.1 hypothetical protein [Acinetobacter higginsii]
MLLSLEAFKQQKFDQMAAKIMADPEHYLTFDSVSDFYKAAWLDEFPQGTRWSATGLDDGAEQFYAVIEYGDHYLYISRMERVTVKLGIRHHYNRNN